MSTYTEFFEKAQAEFVNNLKQAQELNVKALTAVSNLLAQVPTPSAEEPASTQLPTPTEIVERTFAFTNELLETRKQYALQLAELATEAQKQWVDAAKRIADTAKN